MTFGDAACRPCSGDQDVRRLEVAVDHALLVRVLHRLADLDEELEALARRQVVRCRRTR